MWEELSFNVFLSAENFTIQALSMSLLSQQQQQNV